MSSVDRLGAILWCTVLSSCSHVAVYRTKGPAEPIAKQVCETSGPSQPTSERGTLQCFILHSPGFSVRYSGDVFRVIGDAHTQTDVALFLGRSAPEVELVDFE